MLKSELSGYPVVETVFGAIAGWITKYGNSGRRDLQHCDSNEVTRMASELGVTPDQLRDLSGKAPDSADSVQDMLAALDLDPKAVAKADPLVMRDLQRLCATCGNKKRCKHELATGSASGHFRDFCPNAYTLEALVDAKRASS
jgi:hypothetical protein